LPLQQVEDVPTTDTWVITKDTILVNPIEPVILQPQNNDMKRIIDLEKAFAAEIKGALTPEAKRTICEDTKIVIGLLFTGPWANLAIRIVSTLEATIQG